MKKLYHRQIIVLFILSFEAIAQPYNLIIDGMLLQVSQQPSSTWATTISSGTTTGVRTTDINANNIKFNYQPGLRLGLEYLLGGDWSLNVTYSYLNSSTNKDLKLASQIVVPEFFSGFLSGNLFFGADLTWRVLYNTLDLDIGKNIAFTKEFSMRPAIGIKGANIKQKINTTWDAIIYTSHENVKHNFYGLGPSFDFDIAWQFVANNHNNIKLLGNFTTAFVWGKWLVNDTYWRPDVPGGLITATEITTSFNNMQLGVPMLGFLLGLQWSYEYQYKFSFKIGYEMQWWVNQLRIPTFQQLPTRGDLTLQGAICGITIEL